MILYSIKHSNSPLYIVVWNLTLLFSIVIVQPRDPNYLYCLWWTTFNFFAMELCKNRMETIISWEKNNTFGVEQCRSTSLYGSQFVKFWNIGNFSTGKSYSSTKKTKFINMTEIMLKVVCNAYKSNYSSIRHETIIHDHFVYNTNLQGFYHLFVYVLPLGIHLSCQGGGLINQFNPATFLCLWQTRTCMSTSFVFSEFNMRRDCLFYWYLWNCWQSPLKLFL